MSILDQLRRIAQANIDWLTDRSDPHRPEVDRRIAELSEAIEQCKVELATRSAALRRLELEFEQGLQQHAALQTQAESAVAAGDDDAARQLLAERIPITMRLNDLPPQIEQESKAAEELRTSLATLEDQLRRARRKSARLTLGQAGEVPPADGADPARSAEMVEEALAAIKKKTGKP